MVKGISRQIILLDSPDQKIFEQVIFILKDGQREVSDTDLLKEAKCLIPGAIRKRKGRKYFPRAFVGDWWRDGDRVHLVSNGGIVTCGIYSIVV